VVLARAWPELEAGWVRAGARRPQESYGGGRATVAEMRATGGRQKGNGVNPASGHPIYRGVHQICPLRFLLPYKTPQRHYSEKFARRSRRIFANRLQL
jgi:hypothetical protein